MNRFEHAFKVPVQLVLLLFGLLNAGVPFGSVGSGTWIVFAGLVVGKPLGILLMTFLGVKMGLRPPGGLTYAHTLVVGVAPASVSRWRCSFAPPPSRREASSTR